MNERKGDFKISPFSHFPTLPLPHSQYFTSIMRNRLLYAAAFSTFVVAVLLLLPGAARAQQLVYTPENPAFGGPAINYRWMLSSAEAQKSFEEEQFDFFDRNPLENFQQSLQRQILNQLSRQIVERQFGESIDLSQQGRYDLGQFTVEITPGLNGLNIRVFDAFSGDETTITIPNF